MQLIELMMSLFLNGCKDKRLISMEGDLLKKILYREKLT